jgi:hypothetical protein
MRSYIDALIVHEKLIPDARGAGENMPRVLAADAHASSPALRRLGAVSRLRHAA